MKKALVHGERVAQVVPLGSEFRVAEPLVWVDAPDEVVADAWRYRNQRFEETRSPTAVPTDRFLAVKGAIDVALADALVAQSVKDVLAAWRVALGQ